MICHNCGRPQGHRIHDYTAGALKLPGGRSCSDAFTQPRTLWDAVLAPAVHEAAEGAGVDDSTAYAEILRAFRRP